MNLQVGVKVLIQNRQDEYLLIKRTEVMDGETEPHWDIPGGRIEPEETLVDALKREVQEETELELGNEPMLIRAQDIFVPSKDLHVVRLTYKASGEGAVAISDEHQTIQWAKIRVALGLNLDPYLREVLIEQEAQ